MINTNDAQWEFSFPIIPEEHPILKRIHYDEHGNMYETDYHGPLDCIGLGLPKTSHAC